MQRPSFSLYDASAGSGKTYALVKEYLKIILKSDANDAYKNILAITFTNKAVHEMKSRIVGNLSEFSKEEVSPKALELMQDLAGETGLSIYQIKIKSQQIIKHIIHNYAGFDISTIDKFTHRVIRTFAHDLGLPLTFEVTLDTENLLIEAVDAIIAQAGEEDILTKLLVDFTMKKTDDDKSWDISREILDIGKMILNENNREEITHFHNKSIEDFIEIKKKLVESCAILENETISLAQEALLLIENNGIDIKSFSGGFFPKHLISIQDKKYNPKHKKYHKSIDIKINKTAKDGYLIENIIPELLFKLNKIYKIFEKLDFYKAFLKNITPLSLLNTLSNELSKIQKEQNVLSIAEFNSIIYNEIHNQPTPFIYERLGERYRHFFIDEFQDTSEMQWQNLIPLIDNATSSEINGEKGTLMIVGDPKQSIYRWRGGKAEQFIDLSKGSNPFSNPEKKLFHLDTNYRSFSQIIDFNNEFFGFLSNEFKNTDYKDLYANHSRQKSNNKIGGYVNISFITNQDTDEDNDEDALDNSELYLLATLNRINKAKNLGFDLKDIAILTRKRSQGIAVANYLTAQGIALLSSETLMIKNATEVRFIINLLKYLNNNADIEAKANFLQYIAQHKQDKLPIADFIANGMELKEELAFESWLVSFANLNSTSFSFKEFRKKSLFETVETIISKFLQNPNAVNDKPLPSTDSKVPSSGLGGAYVQYFLDIVLEREIKNQASIADFLLFWDKNADKFSIPSPQGKDAIRIMTIHASKGLEFPVVIMPFAEEDYQRKPREKLWLNAEESTIGLSKVLIDNNISVEGYGDESATFFNQKRQEELLDNINVLYVALTRAVEQLYVISSRNLNSKGETKANNMATFFVNYLKSKEIYNENKFEYEFGNTAKLSPENEKSSKVNIIKSVNEILNPKHIKIAQRESLMWGTNQLEAIEYGNIIHEILSLIKTKKDIEIAMSKSIENGLININQKEIIHQSIQEIVNHPELNTFFEEGNQVLNEYAIIQKVGNTLKPDKMVIKTNYEVLLLDYKTGIQKAKHHTQLNDYQKAIEIMGYKVVKKTLIYIGEEIKIVNLAL